MGQILEWTKENPELTKAIASTIPLIMGMNQASKAKKANEDYLKELDTLEKNRQQVVNPYASVTNPFQNMQVATQAAEMQAEQTDIALANTLDTLRRTGAGGATALAQAALKSKQGIMASIEQQEINNAKLAASGEQKMQQLQGLGAQEAFKAQEKREEASLDRLQNLADIEAERRAEGQAVSIGALGDIASSLTGLIDPSIKEE
jgi:hypothetical protein|tara:strand:- start:1787 stop:2401 length:615 start_codon:yes stop_codon:yes gene_type:complete